jgi:uncharacterized Zn finger protein
MDGIHQASQKKVKGGIKAQSKSFGKSWWARWWITVLESFNIGVRLGRGRSYARSGQIVAVSIESGLITARVQGSRSSPYKVTITLKPLSDKEWNGVTKVMADKAIYAAKLLAGEMPQDIEEVFKSAQVSLFPERLNDMKTECSCPDSSNPCKHIAAVYYIVGEEFDRDPFLIFRLRGMQREKLMDSIRRYRGSDSTEAIGLEEDDYHPYSLIKVEEVPLNEDLKTFWQMGDIPSDALGDTSEHPGTAVLLKGLGTPPLWRGQENFLDTMRSLYPCFTKTGLKIILEEQQNIVVKDKGLKKS